MQSESIDDTAVELETDTARRVLLRDLAIVVAVTVAIVFAAVRFDLSEAFYHWTRSLEIIQFDELPIVMLVLAIGFIWFALRRYREAGIAIERQRVADARLKAVLAENRKLARSNVEAQEAERRSIARELHDEMGQYLNAIKIDAIALRDADSVTTDDASAAGAAIVRSADHVYQVVTKMIRRLRPIGLDDLGLAAAVEYCIDQWRPRLANTTIDFAAEGNLSDLSEQANLTVYRIVQEALTNVAKHSNAKHVAVKLKGAESSGRREVSLRIEDDGRGVNLQDGSSGFGLISMRERIDTLGGRFEFQSSPAKGFSLQASFIA